MFSLVRVPGLEVFFFFFRWGVPGACRLCQWENDWQGGGGLLRFRRKRSQVTGRFTEFDITGYL